MVKLLSIKKNIKSNKCIHTIYRYTFTNTLDKRKEKLQLHSLKVKWFKNQLSLVFFCLEFLLKSRAINWHRKVLNRTNF